jgi:hypothetical protein
MGPASTKAVEKINSQGFKICYRKKSDNEKRSVISPAHIFQRTLLVWELLTAYINLKKYTTGLAHFIPCNTYIRVSGGKRRQQLS